MHLERVIVRMKVMYVEQWMTGEGCEQGMDG